MRENDARLTFEITAAASPSSTSILLREREELPERKVARVWASSVHFLRDEKQKEQRD